MSSTSAKRLTLFGGDPPCRSLFIRTAAGPSIGFGHLRRTLILARHLERYASPIFLLDSDDGWSQAQVSANGMEFRLFDHRNPFRGIDFAAALLIDSRKRLGMNRLIADARDQGIPVASIHDLGLAPMASDIVIDGSILPAKNSFPRQDAVFYCGTPYCVLEDACTEHRRHDKKIDRRIRRVVVNLGGGDGGRFFHIVLEGLQATGLTLEVTGLPGFCTWGQEALARGPWNPLHFKWFPMDGDICRLMLEADLIISAGGRSAYEALCLGTPLYALSFDRHQARTISALSQAKACLNLGPGVQLKSSVLAQRLLELDADPARREQLSQSGRRLVDGEGTRRVAGILRNVITKGIPPRPARTCGLGRLVRGNSERFGLSQQGAG